MRARWFYSSEPYFERKGRLAIARLALRIRYGGYLLKNFNVGLTDIIIITEATFARSASEGAYYPHLWDYTKWLPAESRRAMLVEEAD